MILAFLGNDVAKWGLFSSSGLKELLSCLKQHFEVNVVVLWG
jgi:hypothetical protein